ncbi:hypothetical protein GJAV_G00109930 [Gymnothorax javanicus]|nr:hypothetical protein GJAV_G00109930 [Gymnothorax javanicus]
MIRATLPTAPLEEERMAQLCNKGYDDLELLDVLLDRNDVILHCEDLGYHGNPSWPIKDHAVSSYGPVFLCGFY